jgi:hypothetical protein
MARIMTKKRLVPHFPLVLAGAAALAACAATSAAGQDRKASRPAPRAATGSGGVLGILQHGLWQCALPGDADGEAFIEVPEEAFRIGTASSYQSAEGEGIYLLRGNELLFTRGPKQNQRFRLRGENTLQKLDPDGNESKLICTRLGRGL